MTEKLYHTEIGLPEGFQKPVGRVRVSYGKHARKEAFQDRYGVIKLPSFINLRRFRVIEVGMTEGKVSKILFRGTLDETRDLCIVLMPTSMEGVWFAKTCWTNITSDSHRTLDTSRYQSA